MIVKKFQAPTEREAIIKAQEELGSTAVVLNVKTIKQRGFAKLFKKKTGLLISEYLLKCRMERACKLLKTNMSILNIAMETGFNSSTYFSTLFKKYTGKSPQDYRREL